MCKEKFHNLKNLQFCVKQKKHLKFEVNKKLNLYIKIGNNHTL